MIIKIYTDLQCNICSSNVLLLKRPHSNHIESFQIVDRIQIDLTQVVLETMKKFSQKADIDGC